MKKLIFKIIVLLLITSGCGFKVVKQSELVSYSISEIEITGDKRINYNLKNKLLFLTKKVSSNDVVLKINTNKIKTVKEKNIKNEITKYQITINLAVDVQNINKKKSDQFTIAKIGTYNVASQHSQTLNNEKKLIDLLSKSLGDEILEEIALRLNDL